jgi:hypothetical protein
LTRAGEEKGVLEVGDGIDTRAPPVSQRTKKKKRGSGRAGPAARLDGPRGLAGPRAGKEREGEGEGFGEFSFFFSQPFQTFKFKPFFKLLKFKLLQNFSRFKLFSKFKHFKPFQSFQNILKTFKTSHKQTIKSCIQIMMHKHLLLLNY